MKEQTPLQSTMWKEKQLQLKRRKKDLKYESFRGRKDLVELK